MTDDSLLFAVAKPLTGSNGGRKIPASRAHAVTVREPLSAETSVA